MWTVIFLDELLRLTSGNKKGFYYIEAFFERMQMVGSSKKSVVPVSLTVFVLLFFVGLIVYSFSNEQGSPSLSFVRPLPVVIIIDAGENESVYKITVPKGTTVLKSMNMVESIKGLSVVYGPDETVESMFGLSNGSAKMRWTYSVNGIYDDTPASKRSLSQGDVIIWKYGR